MTDVEPEVRAFTPADWRAVCGVHEAAARLELTLSGADPSAFRAMEEEEDLDRFLELNSALVACVDGEVVGFVAWRDRAEWSGSGYLSWLYVDPDHHRQGIGGYLLERAMEALGDQAWTLAKAGNDPAIGLYRRHGMQIVRAEPAETLGRADTEIRLALPTSRKSDPDVPNFGSSHHPTSGCRDR